MKRSIQGLFYFLSIVLFFSACNKKEWDEYYGRPDNLAPPIYQQLQERGNFTSLLAVIDKSGYKDIIAKAGAYTFFAPNDDAFKKYFQENNISGADKIDSATARKIALYGLVYNPYRRDQLTSYQTSAGLIPNSAYRRQTAYYDFVFTENGRKVMSNGINGPQYIATVDNNKYLPYFIDSYFTANALNSTDYTLFYNNQQFSGFNVADAKVVNADIPAENGIIHEIDKVILPLPNIDQYLATKPEYSEFKKLLDKQVLYVRNDILTKRYRVLTGSTDSVYLKSYDAALAFAPNNENYQAISTDGQTSSWSIAVPTNQQLTAYTADLLEYYGSFEAAPQSLLLNFLNSHMWRSTVWPSGLTMDANSQQETATFNESNVVDRKILSNANFYGINKVQEANVFRTVYRHAYLNPGYSLMTRAIDGSDLRAAVLVPGSKYTLFLMSNTDLAAAGYSYNTDIPAWGYTAPGVSIDYSIAATTRINRLVQNSVLSTPFGEFNNLSGEGVAEAYNGEYVKFKNNQVFASGNVADGTVVTVSGSRDAVNGKVYYGNGVLKFAESTVNLGSSLEKLALSTDVSISSKFSHFYNYLITSSLWKAASKDIQGVDAGSFYTLFVPTNQAIEDAVKSGILPGNSATGQPNFSSGTQPAVQKLALETLIQYSILNKVTVAVDGKKPGTYQTILKNSVGDSRLLTVRYPAESNPSPATMEIIDDSAQPLIVRPNVPFSNNLSNRALIHSVDKVLKF